MNIFVTTFGFAGLRRFLFTAGLILAGFSCDAAAATIEWQILPDRERATIQLNKEEGFAGQVSRVDPQGLLLNLGIPPTGMKEEPAPENARIFRMSAARGRSVAFFTKTPAFGYIVTRPDRNTVVIDVFDDPLGARWKPTGAVEQPFPPESGQPDSPAPPAGQPPLAGVSPAASPPPALQTPPTPSAQTPATPAAQVPPAATVPASPAPVLPMPLQSTPAPAAGQSAVTPAAQAQSRNATQPQSSAASPASSPAVQAVPANATQAQRAYYSVPYVFRGRINLGGPSDVDDGGSPQAPMSGGNATQAQAGAARPSNATLAASTGAAGGNATERIQYVDAQGKPVDPPADPVQAIAAVRRDMATGDMKSALEKVTKLLVHPQLSRDQREEVLHLNAELLFAVNRDNLAANYDKIVSAAQEAINYNQQSPRNAGALLRLGYTNLKTGNPSYAEAYFNMLRRQFPNDENIPLTYYYWGEYHYDRNEMQLAADQFQHVVQHFTENQYAREAALGLARSYAQLGYYPQAFQVIDYIEKRWPRFYLDYPPVLEMMGDIGFRMGNLEYALARYWIFYNIVPNNPGVDVILTRIGDAYSLRKQPAAAREIYTEAVRRFPDKDGGLVAMMRLAEDGINDNPSIADMFSVFERPFSLRPYEVYRTIINEHPQSALVPLARLKLAMWYLWNKRYEDAIRTSTELISGSPNSELAPRARDLALKAFGILAAEAIAQNRSSVIQEIWQKFPIVNNQQEALSPESRVALGVSLRDQGNPDKALDVIEPFFLGSKIPEYSEMALTLALDIAVAHDQWQRVTELAHKVETWQLAEPAQRHLDYALALAAENQGRFQDAAPIWKRLNEKGGLSASQQAYVEYFLARDAETKRDLEAAYSFGRSALGRFLELAGQSPEQADRGKIMSLLSSLMDIAETAGRLTEAQQYAQQYLQYLSPQDPQRQGLMLRNARLYKKQGDTTAWRKALSDLAQNYPDSTYGRTAASELRGEKLTEDAAQFSPPGQR